MEKANESNNEIQGQLFAGQQRTLLRMEHLANVLESDMQRNQTTLLRAMETLDRIARRNAGPGHRARTFATVERIRDLIMLKRLLLAQLRVMIARAAARLPGEVERQPALLYEAAQKTIEDVRRTIQERDHKAAARSRSAEHKPKPETTPETGEPGQRRDLAKALEGDYGPEARHRADAAAHHHNIPREPDMLINANAEQIDALWEATFPPQEDPAGQSPAGEKST